jgi:hypothetical protein
MSNFPTYSFKQNQGATMTKSFVVLDSSDQPEDLTGYQARMQLRTTFSATEPALSLDTQSLGGITISLPEAKITVNMTAAQTTALAARDFLYDLEIFTPSNGYVRRLVEGTITIRPEVTR